MIPDEAIEAATEAMFEVFTGENENGDVYVQENSPTRWVVDGTVNLPYLINRILEAAAPYMQVAVREGRYEAEARVKEIVQEVAMTVDYPERLYSAVQEIMRVTRG